MKERNAFFASVFSRELDRWQKETGKTLAQFADKIDVHQNNISRYKKGDAFPSDQTMELICWALNVDKSIFQPSSIQDMIKYDPDFRTAAIELVVNESIKNVDDAGVDSTFFAYLLSIPHFTELFPFSDMEVGEGEPYAYSNCANLEALVKFNKYDLEYIWLLQQKVEDYIYGMLCKAKLMKTSFAADNAEPKQSEKI